MGNSLCTKHVVVVRESEETLRRTDGVGGLAPREAGGQGEGAGVQASKSDQSFSSNPK